jgi:hypothetical protein
LHQPNEDHFHKPETSEPKYFLSKQYKLSLGGLVFSISSRSDLELTVPKPYEAFLVSGGKPDILLESEYGKVPSVRLDEKLFQTDGMWGLYKSGRRFVFHFQSPEIENTPHRMAVIEPDYNSGKIYTRIKDSGREDCYNPLNYPLDEILTLSMLTRYHGMIVHACGMIWDGQGLLFIGTSGAGKTTLAELFRGKSGITLLSDDRIIIRNIDGGYNIYGSPWHGNAQIASPLKAPLKKVFFIKHDDRNRLTELKPIDAISRFIVRCFPTFWEAEGMNNTLDLSERLSSDILCYELGFVPDKSIVDFIGNEA